MKYYSLKNLLAIKVRILLCALFVFFLLGYGAVNMKAALPDAGTCCYQSSAMCVVGSITIDHHYYLKEGKCPN
jgi:hypothetical protein